MMLAPLRGMKGSLGVQGRHLLSSDALEGGIVVMVVVVIQFVIRCVSHSLFAALCAIKSRVLRVIWFLWMPALWMLCD